MLTGGEEVFAAGADLKEMATATSTEMLLRHTERYWNAIAQCPKPVIAAVNGYALGGGCELAMHADIIIAGKGATFGQPEIKVGLMPGAGGTQRLFRAVGKFHAMRMIMTGAMVKPKKLISSVLFHKSQKMTKPFQLRFKWHKASQKCLLLPCNKLKKLH